MTNVLKMAAAGLLAAAWSQGTVQSAELIVYTGMGAANGTYEVAEGFQKVSGHKVTVSSETGPSLKQKLDAKAPADLITGGVEGIQALIKDGHIVASTSTPFGMAGLGVSVKAGARRPDVSTPEAFKAAMLAAKSIGYSRGCSGLHAAAVLEKLGIAEQVKSKVKLTGGGPVVEYLAKGDFEVGIQQTNVMHGVSGSDYVGHIPAAIDQPCQINVGVLTVSKQPDLAREMIKFMTSLDAISWMQKGHLEPVRHGS
jgi:molybdate transport system substrate-binding protein